MCEWAAGPCAGIGGPNQLLRGIYFYIFILQIFKNIHQTKKFARSLPVLLNELAIAG
jgi:hypothetical protein